MFILLKMYNIMLGRVNLAWRDDVQKHPGFGLNTTLVILQTTYAKCNNFASVTAAVPVDIILSPSILLAE